MTQLSFVNDLLLFNGGVNSKFKQFSLASKLHANKLRNVVYMGDVKQCVWEKILEELEFIKGE